MDWRKASVFAAMACGLVFPGCLSISVERRCFDCGGPMSACREDGLGGHLDECTGEGEDECELTCCAIEAPAGEEGQFCLRRLPSIDLWRMARSKSGECVARLRGLCMKPPEPLAPPVARFHPVPTRPVFSPACFEEPPPSWNGGAEGSGVEVLPAPMGGDIDEEKAPLREEAPQ